MEWEKLESTCPPTMSRDIPEKITTKGGHRPRARIHADWSPIGQRLRRNAMLRVVGVILALLLVVGGAMITGALSLITARERF